LGVGNNEDGDGQEVVVGQLVDSANREIVGAARDALSVALTSLFILRRDIPESARTSHISKHLARIDHHLALLAKLIGVTTELRV
jgi:hypothetical protein